MTTGPGGFKDHFSGHADAYAAFRPRYPARLFRLLAEAAPGQELAWDAGTGSGQAALGLAAHFERVVATDASPQQVAAAPEHPRVTFRVGAEAGSGLDDGSADLVTVAQALHWFDRERFWAEVRRVLRPGGLVAVWCYSMARTAPEVDAVVDHLYEQVVGPYWPPERTLVESGYAGIDFPFERVPLAPPDMELELDREGLVGYVSTWSAVRRFMADRGDDPLPAFRERLAAVWGEGTRRVVWPLSLHAGRAHGP